MSTTHRAPHPRLVADIGGTRARFGWVEAPGSAVVRVVAYATSEHSGLAEAIDRYLAEQGVDAPASAGIGVAAPIAGDTVAMTNCGWTFSGRELQGRFGLARLLLLNDFEALAHALPTLRADELVHLGGPPHGAEGAALAVLGPGTGLGVAGFLPLPGAGPGAHRATAAGDRGGGGGRDLAVAQDRGLDAGSAGGAAPQTGAGAAGGAGSGSGVEPAIGVPIVGEGGHVSLSAATPEEERVVAWLRGQFGHVSAERVLSGAGLVNLYRASCALAGAAPQPLDPAAVTAGARAGTDPHCAAAVAWFFGFLGSAAGDLALTLGARGGVYVAGGIVGPLGDAVGRSQFRARFEAKGRYGDYLAAIPTWRLRDPTLPALRGADRGLDATR